MQEPGNRPAGVLQEPDGKRSWTRTSSALFYASWLLLVSSSIYLESIQLTAAADRASEYAFWAFLATVAPNLAKTFIERALRPAKPNG